MKKIYLFVILLLIVFMGWECVNAKSFYEGEYAGKIYTRRTLNNRTIYLRSRFIREIGTDNIAYCIEPFLVFNGNNDYTTTLSFDNINTNALNRIKLLAYYGYLYNNHSDVKWYSITQMAIWKTAVSNGYYEFTDTLNGNTINPYDNEFNELENLVNGHYKTPSFTNQKIDAVIGETILLTDTNNILNEYEVISNNATIENNTIKIDTTTIGNKKILLKRKIYNYDSPSIFYYSPSNQNLITLGKPDDFVVSFEVNIDKTELNLNKKDLDTDSTNPSGNASLLGAIYGIYDTNNNLIQEIRFDKSLNYKIDNLKYGNYYIKEIAAGKGYTLDKTIYNISLTKDNPIITMDLKNKVIEKDISIKKFFGEKDNYISEGAIKFDIYDSNNKLYKTIITNINGFATLTLPYGKYTFKQVNTTKNYAKVDDFTVTVDENTTTLLYELYDQKIEVPNTNKYTIFYYIVAFFKELFNV